MLSRDSVPHVMSQMYSRGKVFNIIENVTDELTSKFLNTTILPSFGNHDPYPTNQMPTADESYYTSILNASHWDRLLNADVTKSFVKGRLYFIFLQSYLVAIALCVCIGRSEIKSDSIFSRPIIFSSNGVGRLISSLRRYFLIGYLHSRPQLQLQL